MNIVEHSIGGATNERRGALRCFRSASLCDVVEAIWDLDIPDGDLARALTIKCAPSTSLQLIGQYRTPAGIFQRTQLLPTKCATQIQSDAVTLHPKGALGVVIVCIRPDAASSIVEAPTESFAGTNVHLGDLFGAREVEMCDELLAAAQTSEERIAGVHAFLLRRIRPRRDSLANRAALYLRRDPTMQMQSLAAELGASTRHLSRSFAAAFGIGPKRFARLVRFQKIMEQRRSGQSWAEVAQACGFSDQAHLVNEFHDIVGQSPTEFFTREIRLDQGIGECNLIVQRAGPAIPSIADS